MISLVCGVLMLVSGVYSSEPMADDSIRLSGYASLVAGYGEEQLPYDFTSANDRVNYVDQWTLKPDSRIGAQLDWFISPQWQAMIQVLARGNSELEPELVWGLINYTPMNALNFRLGRMKAPFYLYSDYADVGYAYPWITPPREAYFVGSDKLDAVNVTYDFITGDVEHQLEAYYGELRDDYNGNEAISINAYQLHGIIWRPTWNWLTLRFSYHRSEHTEFNHGNAEFLKGAVNDLVDLGLVSREHAERVDLKNIEATYAGVGFKMDFDDFWLMGEYNELTFDNVILPDHRRSYLSAGYSISDAVQVFVIHENTRDDFDHQTSRAIAGAAGFFPAPLGSQLSALSSSVYGQELGWKIDSSSLGIRWDFKENMAFKAQVTHIKDHLRNASANVVRISIDTVF